MCSTWARPPHSGRACAGSLRYSQPDPHKPRSWSIFFKTALDHSAAPSTCLMKDVSTLLFFDISDAARSEAVLGSGWGLVGGDWAPDHTVTGSAPGIAQPKNSPGRSKRAMSPARTFVGYQLERSTLARMALDFLPQSEGPEARRRATAAAPKPSDETVAAARIQAQRRGQTGRALSAERRAMHLRLEGKLLDQRRAQSQRDKACLDAGLRPDSVVLQARSSCEGAFRAVLEHDHELQELDETDSHLLGGAGFGDTRQAAAQPSGPSAAATEHTRAACARATGSVEPPRQTNTIEPAEEAPPAELSAAASRVLALIDEPAQDLAPAAAVAPAPAEGSGVLHSAADPRSHEEPILREDPPMGEDAATEAAAPSDGSSRGADPVLREAAPAADAAASSEASAALAEQEASDSVAACSEGATEAAQPDTALHQPAAAPCALPDASTKAVSHSHLDAACSLPAAPPASPPSATPPAVPPHPAAPPPAPTAPAAHTSATSGADGAHPPAAGLSASLSSIGEELEYGLGETRCTSNPHPNATPGMVAPFPPCVITPRGCPYHATTTFLPLSSSRFLTSHVPSLAPSRHSRLVQPTLLAPLPLFQARF